MHQSLYNKMSLYSRTTLSPDIEGSGGGVNTELETTINSNSEPSPKQPSIDEIIKKAVEEAVSGLKNKNTEVILENKKLKEQLKNTNKPQAPTISDDELKAFNEYKQRLEKDVMLKAISEGRTDEVIESVTKRTRDSYEARLAAELEEKSRLAKEAEEARSELKNTRKRIDITAAAAKLIKPEYHSLIETIVGPSTEIIDGKTAVVDDSGEPVYGSDGAPLSVTKYVESLRSKYPDLYLTSSGGGSNGNNGGTKPRLTTNITMDQLSEMSMDDYIKWRTSTQNR